MSNKRLLGLFFAGMLFSVIFTGVVSAEGFVDEASGLVTDLIDFITQGVAKPIFEFLLGDSSSATEADFVAKALNDSVGNTGTTGTSGTGADFVAKALLVILTVAVVVAVLDAMPLFEGKKKTNIIIGIVIAVLGTRFLPDGFVTQITYPSSAFVAVLAIGLPFVLLFFLMKDISSSHIRRAGWVIFGVIIFLLLAYNIENDSMPESAKWLYPFFILGCVLAFWFDGTLASWWAKAAQGRALTSVTSTQMARLRAEIKDLEVALGDASDKEARTLKGKITRKMKRLNELTERLNG